MDSKNKKKIINLVMGIVICLFLCFLEVILYVLGVSSKYGYIIIGSAIVLILVLDIVIYFRNKDE